MPNKWVEFVKKWSAENNMNYMCAMTTKECKEAYLKAHPKEPKKAKKETRKKGTYSTIEIEGWLIWDIQNEGIDKVVSLDAWSGSLDDIKAIAKKHNVGITKYLRKTELATLNSIIKGLENDDTRENVFHFFEDIQAMLEGYIKKAEGKKDAPAPDRSKVQKELVDMGKKAMEVADKRANIQMELSEMGKKAKLKEAQKEAQKYLSTKGMVNKAKQIAVEKEQMRAPAPAKKAVPAPAKEAVSADIARFQEAEANPALKVLTNPDLLKTIGSFTNPRYKNVDDFFKMIKEDALGKKFEYGVLDKYKVAKLIKNMGVLVKSDWSFTEQIEKIFEILTDAMRLKDVKDPDIELQRLREYDGSYYEKLYWREEKYKEARKTIEIILSGKLPDYFDYDYFWRRVNKTSYPLLTVATNPNLKKIFKNWKSSKGSKKSNYDIGRATSVLDPNA